MENQETGFTPDELTLGYTEWSRLVEQRKNKLAPEVRQWLGKWKLWDLACSPMDDNERRHIRYGHYLGWWHREEVTQNVKSMALSPCILENRHPSLPALQAKMASQSWFWDGGGDILPRMDGGKTWRAARICGARAIYPGHAPSMLANMAPPKLLVI